LYYGPAVKTESIFIKKLAVIDGVLLLGLFMT
jgi:hypothetical protein